MKAIQRTEWASLILVLAFLLGTFLRFNPTLLAGFPINDGGMFAAMIEDLETSRYLLPVFTTYNHLDIPYVYSPLGFYLGRIASDLFGWSPVSALRWLPAFFASLSIPAFFWFALRLLKNKYYAAVSTLFFAFMPRAFSWFVMGGGLTRSLGQLFMLLAFAAIVRLYEENRRSDVLLAGIFSGLVVLSHPEAAVHTFLSAIFLWLMLSRKRSSFLNSVLVGILVLIITAPWWVTVISYHGVDPLIHGAQTEHSPLAVFHLLFFVFTQEPYATVIAVLGLLGIGVSLVRRDYLLLLWMVIPFFVEGRSALGPAPIPLSMLAAVGLVDVVLAAMQSRVGKAAEPSEPISPVEPAVFLYLTLYLIFSAYQFGMQLSSATLYPADQEAMSWVRENTPEEARFLVLTGTSSVSCDSVLEWFPVLTGRQSIYTVQGREWLQGRSFSAYISSTYPVQECLASGDVPCLDAAIDRSKYDYVYITKLLRANNCSPLGSPLTFPLFLQSIHADQRFQEVYETQEVVIFRQR